jgi:hypothetical protein
MLPLAVLVTPAMDQGYRFIIEQIEANFMAIITREDIGTPIFITLNICYIIQTAFMMPVMFLGARNNLVQLMKPRYQYV